MNRLTQLQTFARAGYAARGFVYLLLGYFAWLTGGGEATTTVMRRIQDMPLGTPALFLIAFGMFGYGLFRLFGAWIDIDGKGSDAKGLFGRAGPALSGAAHLLLTFAAITIALGMGRGGGGEREMADTAQSLPGGTVLLIVAGLVGFGAAIGNFIKAWSASFMEDLDPKAPAFAKLAGRAGYGARGVVFAVIGWQILSLAFGYGGGELGMEAALQELRSRDWLFPLVAIGLGAFGLFSLIMARFAQIRNVDLGHHAKQAGRWFRRD